MGEGNYEPGTVRLFDKILGDGDQVIIAGAHQGYFACHCSKLVGDKGKVFAFEPEPANNHILTKATEGLANVEVLAFALGDRNIDEVKFYLNSDNNGGHALWDVSKHDANVKTRENPQVITVAINTIDRLFADRDMSRLKLLMLDAEGAEHAILMGAINTLVDCEVPYVICEVNNFAMENCCTSQMAMRNFMAVYGFEAYLVEDDSVQDIGKGKVTKNGNNGEEYVFNLLFSRRGKV